MAKITDFFKKGHFIATLEQSMTTLEKRLSEQTASLREVQNDSLIKGLQIEQLKTENNDLKSRVQRSKTKFMILKLSPTGMILNYSGFLKMS